MRPPTAPGPRPAGPGAARHRDGNDEDVRYLLEARAALFPIMAASRAAATLAGSPHVRSLARVALAEQGDQLAAITACLHDWGHTDPADPAPARAGALADVLTGLRGPEVDRVFVLVLTDHARASLVRARVEMVAGASPLVRPIAEAAIHEHDRRLAALQHLGAATGSRDVRLIGG